MVNNFEFNPADNIGEKEEKEPEVYTEAKLKLEEIFNDNENGLDRINYIKAHIQPLAKLLENGEAMLRELADCVNISDKDQFVNSVFLVLKPLLDYRIENPEAFGVRQPRDEEFIAINELLSYGLGDSHIHIHMVPDKKVENFISALKDGMRKLTEIVRNNENIKEVTATSWIVAEHPKLMERFGFVIDGEVDDNFRREHFAGDFDDETRPIWKAHISREALLEKYIKNKS
ncbi:MAG: hypothetical protein P4L62_04255 [Candidatus Pacebacteria bacterium]|nr:hypothetical protein [Candidatus Paceibacterota bacterium]MDR3583543.1 hypothetical protein [Candidatus Paceibacterota bacterium]